MVPVHQSLAEDTDLLFGYGKDIIRCTCLSVYTSNIEHGCGKYVKFRDIARNKQPSRYCKIHCLRRRYVETFFIFFWGNVYLIISRQPRDLQSPLPVIKIQ